MATIKKSKLIETLKTKNINENFISDLISKIKQSGKQKKHAKLVKDLEDITNDPEYQDILKKYNITPMDWR